MIVASIPLRKAMVQLSIVWMTLGAVPAVAEEDATTADYKQLDMIAAARKKFIAVPAKRRCGVSNDDGEIVVCGRDNGEDQRVPPSSEANPSLNTGDLRPPDFVPHYPGVTVARGCFIPPCPKPPVYYFDIKGLPKAAEGSDADKIGTGEMRGP
jgi:hypothetical protein